MVFYLFPWKDLISLVYLKVGSSRGGLMKFI